MNATAKPQFDLNSSQKSAVEHIQGPLLVVAGAGSGKTRVIVEKIKYLVELGIKPFNILAITFTNKAANEMRERIAIYGVEGAWICTFHSMCVRILRKEAHHLGLSEQFSIFDTDDQNSVLRSVLKELELDPAEWKLSQLLSKISSFKNANVSAEQAETEARHYRDRIVARIYAMYEKSLSTNQALDFDDLLIKTLGLFQSHQSVLELYQQKFKYLLVDEYQDTNQIQYQLILALSKNIQGMTLTGDPDQSIYSWRGADINNILNFQKDFPGADIIKMEDNYRSTRHILELSNQLVRHNTERYPKDLKTANEDGPLPHLHCVYSAEEESESIAQLIAEKRAAGYPLKNIAIFYRTNAQSRSIEEGLRLKNIPYIIIGGVKFFDRMEVKDLIAYLRFIHNPADSISLMRIVNKPSRGISESTKAKIRTYADDNGLSCWESMIADPFLKSIPKRAADSVRHFNQLIADYFELSFSSPDILLEKILDTTKIIDSYKKKNGEVEEDRIENIQEFMSYVREFCQQQSSVTLSTLLEQISLVNDKKEGNEENDNIVTLMTLHAAKGLEFPVVYFAGLDEGLLPHQRSIDMAHTSAIEEERRLCYVGITRAQEELHLFNAKERFTFKGPKIFKSSRFISEMQGEHMMTSKRGQVIKPNDSIFKTKRSSTDKSKLRKGEAVRHAKYGKGVILKLEGRGASEKAKIYFDKHGEKNILLQFEPIEALS